MYADNIEQNYSSLLENMSEICAQAGRNPGEITIVAVTKTRGAEEINRALALGIPAYGENRVQELLEKYPNITSSGQAFFIGQLQSNKVKYIIDKVDMIQSLDRLTLASEINRQAVIHQRVMPVLIEVNIGREESKAGIEPEKDVLKRFCDDLSDMPGLRLGGLMTVAPACADTCQKRGYFSAMYGLYEVFCRHMGLKKAVLSMGMSNDYKEAVMEGSNMIRPGRILFGERK